MSHSARSGLSWCFFTPAFTAATARAAIALSPNLVRRTLIHVFRRSATLSGAFGLMNAFSRVVKETSNVSAVVIPVRMEVHFIVAGAGMEVPAWSIRVLSFV